MVKPKSQSQLEEPSWEQQQCIRMFDQIVTDWDGAEQEGLSEHLNKCSFRELLQRCIITLKDWQEASPDDRGNCLCMLSVMSHVAQLSHILNVHACVGV